MRMTAPPVETDRNNLVIAHVGLVKAMAHRLAQRLPAYTDSGAILFSALPYVLTLIAVAGVIGRSTPPAADGIPYKKQ